MKEITVRELKEKRDKKEDILLIDVREPDEAEICEIGGELIPMGEILDNLDKIPEDKQVVLHCRSGGRSGKVVEKLEQMGYDNVYNLKGGILAWSQEIDPSVPQY